MHKAFGASGLNCGLHGPLKKIPSTLQPKTFGTPQEKHPATSGSKQATSTKVSLSTVVASGPSWGRSDECRVDPYLGPFGSLWVELEVCTPVSAVHSQGSWSVFLVMTRNNGNLLRLLPRKSGQQVRFGPRSLLRRRFRLGNAGFGMCAGVSTAFYARARCLARMPRFPYSTLPKAGWT